MREGKGVGKREEEEERGDRRKGGKREVSLANHDRYLWNCPVRVRPLDRPVILFVRLEFLMLAVLPRAERETLAS